MTVNTYLTSLASDLVLTDSEKSHITKSIDSIKSKLDNYFSDVVEKKIFGSYVRGTILPRKADEKSDIDLMVVFSNPYDYKPQSFLNRLKKFAEYYYSTSEIHQSSPTIVLELNHIKIELTPAYKFYDWYYIPNGPSEWMYTDPDGFYQELTECNIRNSYKIKPIVRLIKHWNIQKNYRDLESFLLEKKIAKDMLYALYSCTSYVDYLKKALEVIKCSTDYNRVDLAILRIDLAMEYEKNNMTDAALTEIKKVFPEV